MGDVLDAVPSLSGLRFDARVSFNLKVYADRNVTVCADDNRL